MLRFSICQKNLKLSTAAKNLKYLLTIIGMVSEMLQMCTNYSLIELSGGESELLEFQGGFSKTNTRRNTGREIHPNTGLEIQSGIRSKLNLN